MSIPSRTLKFTYFVLGIALPIAGYVLWSKAGCGCKKSRIDKAHDTSSIFGFLRDELPDHPKGRIEHRSI